ncbi:PKD domain-containing protein [Rathayibacter sp. CAU 1779]
MFDKAAGLCTTGTIAGDHVDVGATTGGSGHGASDASGTNEDSGGADEDPRIEPSPLVCDRPDLCPLGHSAPAGPEPAPPGAGVSMSDLASFYPQAPTVLGEPNGWAIVGLDANFVSQAPEHVASGVLLGQPASVRFTPVRFAWDYGDGTGAAGANGGATWKDLGLPEFSPTATSHVYEAPGSYPVRLTVSYTATYRIGDGPWSGVPGSLNLSAPTFTVVAGDAKTVLVQRTCQADPTGPGC